MKKSEITRQKILLSSENEFAEKGFFGARVDEIAENAGVNKRMIYEHFGNKEELYKTVLLGVYKRLAEYEETYYGTELTPDAAIKNIVYGSFGFLKTNPHFVRILMWENLNNGKFLEGVEIGRVKAPLINYIKKQIKNGQESGIFSSDLDTEQVIVSILNFEFSYFSNIYTLSQVLDKNLTDDAEIEKRAEFLSELLLDYLSKK
jgi:TetR/AcrR family transcriptional regulator